MRLRATLLIGALVTAAPLAAQRGDSSRVTIERLFGSDDFSSDRTPPIQWVGHTGATYSTIGPDSAGNVSIMQIDAATGRRLVVVPASRLIAPRDSQPLGIEEFTWSADGRRLLLFVNSARVWRENTRGDYWVYDVASGTLRQLGGPDAQPSTLMFATFSPDGNQVAYVREHNVYVESVADGHIAALTTDGSKTTINGTFDWVYEEELNDRNGIRWSPDGQHVAFWQLDASRVRDFDLIDDTDSLYSFINPVQFPVAGTANSAARIGIASASGGPIVWLAVPGDPFESYIARMDWAGPDAVALQHLNRLQDTLDVMIGDIKTGAVRTVVSERDSAWVDVVDDLRWFDHGAQFAWVSDRDGSRRLYRVSRDGHTTLPITPAGTDLANPGSAFGAPFTAGIDSIGQWVYYNASPHHATQLYLYRAKLDGSRSERLTPANQTGVHHYDVSPDGRFAVHRYSSFGTPPVVQLVTLPEHKVVRTVTENGRLRRTVQHLARGPVEFFTVDNGEGVPLDGWMIKPPGFDSTKKYPILFMVYGGPAEQTVMDQWDGDDYLWHLMLSQQGYIIASVDNRGTPAPKGRAFRKAIYKRMGVVESRDQAAAARAILRRPYADATRVGVWGWSNGGTMTLNLLFRSPEIYRMGMAVAPVTDQRFYDTIYSERYLGLPADNVEVYRQASPITFVERLRGDLLVVHGSGDDNVHYQNSETLINALVAADKQFTMMDYPNRTHCICEGSNTSRHLFALLERYLHDHLPAGPVSMSAAAR
jgi:dipeptidyl-peptidase 4